jgi:hypothetical protein
MMITSTKKDAKKIGAIITAVVLSSFFGLVAFIGVAIWLVLK